MKTIKYLAACSMLALAGAFATATSATAQEGRPAYVDRNGVCQLCQPGYSCPCAILPPIIIS